MNIEALLIINPDNPSGNLLSKAEVRTLLMWSWKRDIRLIVDESFLDFAHGGGEISLLDNQILADNPHLAVIKSISASYGVLGLRLGMTATSDADLINRIRKDVSMRNINSFAEFYMQIYGKYERDYRKACLDFIAEREHFFRVLQDIDFLRVIPSEANYFLCEVTGRFASHDLTDMLLKSHNILIKDCGGRKGISRRELYQDSCEGESGQ